MIFQLCPTQLVLGTNDNFDWSLFHLTTQVIVYAVDRDFDNKNSLIIFIITSEAIIVMVRNPGCGNLIVRIINNKNVSYS